MNTNLDRQSNRFPAVRLSTATLIAAVVLSFGTMAAGSSPGGDLRLGQPKRTQQGVPEVALELRKVPAGLTGLQFDLVSTDRDVEVEGWLSSELAHLGKSLHVRRLGPGVFRFLIAGFNQRQIPPGTVAMVAIMGGDTSPPAFDGFSILRVVGTDGQGRRLEIGVAREADTEPGGIREPHGRFRQP